MHCFSRCEWVSRLAAFGITLGIGIGGFLSGAAEAQQPIRIGLSIAQTGPLSSGGKSGLVALEMWRDDVNARGGLLGRPVEVIAYDDQGNPSMTPGIYTKLLDVDKVDLLISPYGTNLTAPIMPLVKQRDLLIVGNFVNGINEQLRHDKWFNILPWSSRDLAKPFIALAGKLDAKTIAMLAADAEFAQKVVGGMREEMKDSGLELIYDQSYPPNTVEFTSLVRAIRAKKPDAVFVASYPADSIAIIRSLNEIGIGDTVRLFGGAMAGLQYSSVMESLGSQLNGVVNFNNWVPEKTMEIPGIRDFLARYQVRARQAKVDPLGFYLPPFDYAIGEIFAQAISATHSLDHKVLAKYLHENELKTIVGAIRFGPTGEWATPRVVYIQFRDIADKNLDQFRSAGKQVIVAPNAFKTGEAIPFYQTRN